MPRENDYLQMSDAEKVITDAMGQVEKAGADPLLTEALNLLIEARAKVLAFATKPA